MSPVRILPRFLALAALAIWFAGAQANAAADRVALVIGNSRYEAVATLQNASNDADGVAAALREIGFEVDVAKDLTNAGLSDALRQFHRKSTGSKIALIYYAGHGIEIEKNNYLIPVDAKLERAADVFFEAVPMENALLAVEGASELSLLILDACRNNPFAAAMQRSGGTRSVGRGLALVEPSGNSLVAYAAKGGTTALDGDGQNSPYAQALMQALREPNVELSLLFRKVRDDVLEATNGEQEPFVYGSLSAKELFLNKGDGEAVAEKPTETPAVDDRLAHLNGQFAPAFVTWTAIQALERGVNQQRALEAFVQEFGDSPYAASARVMLQSYENQGAADRATTAPDPVERTEDQSPTGADVDLSRDQRRLVQRGLAAAGYSIGAIDGIFGDRTRAAIVSWQDQEGVRVTSYLSLDQAARLMDLGRNAPVAPAPTPQAPSNGVATQPVQPQPQPQDNRTAAVQPAPQQAGKPSGRLFLDMTLSYRDDGREINKNFRRTITVTGGVGRYQASNTSIGKLGPFVIGFTVSGNTLSYNGQIVGKEFAGSSTMIGGATTPSLTFLQRGDHYKLLIRANFVED